MANDERMNILFVDDEKEFTDLMQHALRTVPHHIETVNTAEEALEKMRGKRVDLLLTDVRMPGMSGMTLMEKALDLYPDLLVIGISAHGRLDMAVEFMKKGAVDFLQKPIDTLDIQLAIQGAADTWRLRRELSVANRHLQEMNKSLQHEVHERRKVEDQLRTANQELQATLQELSQTQQQLIKQERLGALGQMARGIAHDFNNALQPIMLAAGFIQSDPKRLMEMGILNEYIDEIVQSTESAAATVKRLVRFYSSSSQVEQDTLDLSELIESVVDVTRPRWKNEALAQGKDIEVRMNLTPGCLVEGYREDYREVFVNLVFNAVEAIKERGAITLSTWMDETNVYAKVEDDGCGMTEDMKAHCIEPFVTTRTQKGSGLGLSVVHGVVSNYDGTLDILSKCGEGTTLMLTFARARSGKPSSAASRAKPTTRSDLEPLPPELTFRILLVDDELPMRRMTSRVLKRLGHEVVVEESGQRGWELFQQSPFDLVITDQAMPGLTGEQLAALIAKHSPGTPVIMVTGFGDLLRARENAPEGVTMMLSKPVQVEQLTRAIQSVAANKEPAADAAGTAGGEQT